MTAPSPRERYRAAFAAEPSLQRVADRFGVSRGAVYRHVKDLIARKAAAAPAPAAPPPPEDPIELVRRRIENARALDLERQALKDVAGERSLRASLEALLREVAPRFPAPAAAPPPRPAPRGASAETAVLQLSDWHAYERVSRERTLGFNGFDAPTLARRVHRIAHKVIDIADRMEAGRGWQIPRLVVGCNGDFVSGTIHDVERHLDAPNIIMSVYGTGMLLAHAIRDFAARFPEVVVYCTSGNHGRLPDARKMQLKDPTRNWDTVVYMFAREALRDLPNVRFEIPDSYALTFEVGSKKFLQYHGHGVKGWAGIPHYGIQRYVRGTTALMGQRGERLHYALISHFHSDAKLPAAGVATYVNGSVIGGTELSVEHLGECDVPMQKLLFVSDPIGVNSEWPIYGEVPGEAYAGTYPPYPWRVDEPQPARGPHRARRQP